MAKVREHYWVPRLSRLVKNIRSHCNGCKRFRAKAYQVPPPENLPTTRTQGAVPFEVIGVDRLCRTYQVRNKVEEGS